MDASDMMDVIHVFYEQDITPRHEHDIEIKDKIRQQLYPLLYNRQYTFGVTKSSSMGPVTRPRGEDWERMPDLPESQVGSSQPVKPFIPATNIEDLPGILDAPLR